MLRDHKSGQCSAYNMALARATGRFSGPFFSDPAIERVAGLIKMLLQGEFEVLDIGAVPDRGNRG